MLQHLFYGKFEFYIEMFAAQKRPYHIKFIEKQNQVDVCRLIRALTLWLFFFDTNNRRSSKYSLYSSRHFFVSSWIWIADYREKKNQTKIESKEENKSEPNQLKFNHPKCDEKCLRRQAWAEKEFCWEFHQIKLILFLFGLLLLLHFMNY